MSSSSLVNEDLDNVPLVRMEDVQPSRERTLESRSPSKDDVEFYETCLIDNVEYINEYVIKDNDDDEDSNIGSMVSLQSEDVYQDDDSNQELIIPEDLDKVQIHKHEEPKIKVFVRNERANVVSEEFLEDPIEDDRSNAIKVEDDLNVADGKYMELIIDPDLEEDRLQIGIEDNIESIMMPNEYSPIMSEGKITIEVPPIKKKKVEELVTKPQSEKWPTLEILPGGVIKNTDKYDNDILLCADKVPETEKKAGEMMYACAKCSQTFKYLFCLVKHVRWHEDEKKIMKDNTLDKMSATEQELINLKRERLELDRIYKKQKLQVLIRIAAAIEKIKNVAKFFNKSPLSEEYICLHSSKKNIAVTEKKRKPPKKVKS